jgi:hypothetical protein
MRSISPVIQFESSEAGNTAPEMEEWKKRVRANYRHSETRDFRLANNFRSCTFSSVRQVGYSPSPTSLRVALQPSLKLRLDKTASREATAEQVGYLIDLPRGEARPRQTGME